MDGITGTIVEFVRNNQAWAAPIVFLLAFLESLAFLSLLVPATAILLGISTLGGAAGINFWPIWLAGGLGGVIGYSISYQIGAHFGEDCFKIWPFHKYPDLIARTRAFFLKWGAWAVFLGHFIGPIRAFIPVVAGAYRINRVKFEVANIAAAFIWSTSVLAPGFYGVGLLSGALAK